MRAASRTRRDVADASPLWGNLISGAAVFIATAGLLGTWVNQRMTPLEDRLGSVDKHLDKIDTTMAPLLTLYAQHKADEDRFTSFQIQIDQKLDKNVFEVSRNANIDRISALVVTDNKAMDEILHQVHDLENKIVSREENVVHWNATDALALRVNALADKVNNSSCLTPSPPTAK